MGVPISPRGWEPPGAPSLRCDSLLVVGEPLLVLPVPCLLSGFRTRQSYGFKLQLAACLLFLPAYPVVNW